MKKDNNILISVKVSQDQKEDIEEKAQQANLTMSQYLATIVELGKYLKEQMGKIDDRKENEKIREQLFDT